MAGGAMPLKIAWLGSADGECAQLLERIGQVCAAHGKKLQVEHLPVAEWDSPSARDADRVVIACETRLDYPWQTIAALQSQGVYIPWGVVTGVWHAGSRRTGIGTVTHWQLPWYRWWGGWRGWFFPELSRSGSLCPSQFELVTLPIDLATPSTARMSATAGISHEITAENAHQNLLIVAACQQTAASWRSVAEHVGWNSEVVRAVELGEIASAYECAHAPEVILWDDSCQDRLPQSVEMQQSCEQCSVLARRFPGVPIIAALTLGHLAAWPQLRAVGVSDYFIKPSHALPLADYLVTRAASANCLVHERDLAERR